MRISQYSSQTHKTRKGLNTFLNMPFTYFLYAVVCFALFQNQIECQGGGIMEITFNNLKNVLNTYN
jgi:hypothetical protein